jgi:predicted DNA-binding transcriptional regulator AlpA
MTTPRLAEPTVMLTPDQAARALAISRGTLQKLLNQARAGDPSGLRSVRLAPQVVRVPRCEIDAFIARRLANGHPASVVRLSEACS